MIQTLTVHLHSQTWNCVWVLGKSSHSSRKQIFSGILGKFSYFIVRRYIECTHYNHFIEAILMNTLNKPLFYRRSISKLSPFVSWPCAMINPQWLKPPTSKAYFHGSKDVQAIVQATKGQPYLYCWYSNVNIGWKDQSFIPPNKELPSTENYWYLFISSEKHTLWVLIRSIFWHCF